MARLAKASKAPAKKAKSAAGPPQAPVANPPPIAAAQANPIGQAPSITPPTPQAKGGPVTLATTQARKDAQLSQQAWLAKQIAASSAANSPEMAHRSSGTGERVAAVAASAMIPDTHSTRGSGSVTSLPLNSSQISGVIATNGASQADLWYANVLEESAEMKKRSTAAPTALPLDAQSAQIDRYSHSSLQENSPARAAPPGAKPQAGNGGGGRAAGDLSSCPSLA